MVFIRSGLAAAQQPGARPDLAAPVLDTLREKLPLPLPEDNDAVVRANGVAQVVAGASLALGIAPRLSAAVLIGSLVPTTLAGHRYWEKEDQKERAAQKTHFDKNLGLIGGLLVVVASGGKKR